MYALPATRGQLGPPARGPALLTRCLCAVHASNANREGLGQKAKKLDEATGEDGFKRAVPCPLHSRAGLPTPGRRGPWSRAFAGCLRVLGRGA